MRIDSNNYVGVLKVNILQRKGIFHVVLLKGKLNFIRAIA